MPRCRWLGQPQWGVAHEGVRGGVGRGGVVQLVSLEGLLGSRGEQVVLRLLGARGHRAPEATAFAEASQTPGVSEAHAHRVRGKAEEGTPLIEGSGGGGGEGVCWRGCLRVAGVGLVVRGGTGGEGRAAGGAGLGNRRVKANDCLCVRHSAICPSSCSSLSLPSSLCSRRPAYLGDEKSQFEMLEEFP